MKKLAILLIIIGVTIFLFTYFLKPITKAVEEKINPDETGKDTATGLSEYKPFTEL